MTSIIWSKFKYKFEMIIQLLSNSSFLGGEEETDCMFLSCHVRISEWIYTL